MLAIILLHRVAKTFNLVKKKKAISTKRNIAKRTKTRCACIGAQTRKGQ